MRGEGEIKKKIKQMPEMHEHQKGENLLCREVSGTVNANKRQFRGRMEEISIANLNKRSKAILKWLRNSTSQVASS